MSYAKWGIVISVFVIATGTFYFWHTSSPAVEDQGPALAFDSIPATGSASSTVTTSAQPRTPPEGYKEYRNPDYGFSVFYPQNLPPKETKDRGFALTVSFQAEAGKEGFQIYVAPINGTKVTAERFRLDEPSGVRKNERSSTIDGASAAVFEGFNTEIGATEEVWFIRNGFLFEVSTYKDLAKWLDGIMSTWQFI